MTDYSYWALFLSAAFIINISPGPDILYILSQTFSYGRKTGFISSLGVCTGALFHVTLVAFGLSAILSTSVLVFTVIKYIGAAYLFYLGVKAILSKGTVEVSGEGEKGELKALHAFRQGMLVDILNPKVALFFIAFIPQFVRPEHGSFTEQTFMLGTMVILMAIPIEWTIVLLADKTASFINAKPAVSALLDKITGSILIGLGLNLVLSSNRD
ncbi:MAG TPA: LysE family translocator [Spirochaetota bacterium]|nr:LysE family translocator [Spirochaetota bacterium]